MPRTPSSSVFRISHTRADGGKVTDYKGQLQLEVFLKFARGPTPMLHACPATLASAVPDVHAGVPCYD
eukprot:974004-Rhodomonas_salina.1